MSFLRPMLVHQIKHSRFALDGADVIAEPKLDGVRAQVHVADHRTAAIYSRTGIRMDSQKGLEWIRPVGDLGARDGRRRGLREAPRLQVGPWLAVAVLDQGEGRGDHRRRCYGAER
jgi:ATP dependent DNA ligase domain